MATYDILGTLLEFRLGPSLLGHRVKIYTNCPEAGDHAPKFCRSSYRVLEWSRDSDNAKDDTAVFVDLKLGHSGSFRFYFETEGYDLGGEGYFLVDPVLRDGVQCYSEKKIHNALENLLSPTLLSNSFATAKERRQH